MYMIVNCSRLTPPCRQMPNFFFRSMILCFNRSISCYVSLGWEEELKTHCTWSNSFSSSAGLFTSLLFRVCRLLLMNTIFLLSSSSEQAWLLSKCWDWMNFIW